MIAGSLSIPPQARKTAYTSHLGPGLAGSRNCASTPYTSVSITATTSGLDLQNILRDFAVLTYQALFAIGCFDEGKAHAQIYDFAGSPAS